MTSIKPGDVPEDLRGEVNKRLTLNLLIQGAAAHTYTTASHLVRDDLEGIRKGLTRLYDRFAIAGQLNYCIGDVALAFGRPNKWFGFSSRPQDVFRDHPLMARHGNALARAETRRLWKLSLRKLVFAVPLLIWGHLAFLLLRVFWAERHHKHELRELAVSATSEIWGIDRDRLDGDLTMQVAFGNIRAPVSVREAMMSSGIAGYGGVRHQHGQLQVVAKAWVFPLLVHELVKGTMELICLHGLNELDDQTCARVLDHTDRLHYEAWMIQAGPELWRKLIALAPRRVPLSEVIMQLARLNPEDLERVMLNVIEDPEQARADFESICPADD